MNLVKEYGKKTTAINQIRHVTSDLRDEVRTFISHLDSHTLYENKSTEPAILQLYNTLLGKYSACKKSLEEFFSEQQDTKIQLDANRTLGEKKVSRKQQKNDLAGEEFVVAYMDAERMLGTVSALLTEAEKRVKEIVEAVKPQKTMTEAPKAKTQTPFQYSNIPMDGSRLDSHVEAPSQGSRLDSHIEYEETPSRLESHVDYEETPSRLDSHIEVEPPKSRMDSTPLITPATSRLDSSSTKANPNGEGK